jgi:hypothetical protein
MELNNNNDDSDKNNSRNCHNFKIYLESKKKIYNIDRDLMKIIGFPSGSRFYGMQNKIEKNDIITIFGHSKCLSKTHLWLKVNNDPIWFRYSDHKQYLKRIISDLYIYKEPLLLNWFDKNSNDLDKCVPNALFYNSKNTNFTIYCENNEKVEFHNEILIQFEYFKLFVEENSKEINTKNDNIDEICLRLMEIEKITLEEIKYYMYHIELPKKIDDLVKLLKFSDKYLIRHLSSLVCDEINLNIFIMDSKKVLELLKLGKSIQLEPLIDLCFQCYDLHNLFIENNLIESKDIEKLYLYNLNEYELSMFLFKSKYIEKPLPFTEIIKLSLSKLHYLKLVPLLETNLLHKKISKKLELKVSKRCLEDVVRESDLPFFGEAIRQEGTKVCESIFKTFDDLKKYKMNHQEPGLKYKEYIKRFRIENNIDVVYDRTASTEDSEKGTIYETWKCIKPYVLELKKD